MDRQSCVLTISNRLNKSVSEIFQDKLCLVKHHFTHQNKSLEDLPLILDLIELLRHLGRWALVLHLDEKPFFQLRLVLNTLLLFNYIEGRRVLRLLMWVTIFEILYTLVQLFDVFLSLFIWQRFVTAELVLWDLVLLLPRQILVILWLDHLLLRIIILSIFYIIILICIIIITFIFIFV